MSSQKVPGLAALMTSRALGSVALAFRESVIALPVGASERAMRLLA